MQQEGGPTDWKFGHLGSEVSLSPGSASSVAETQRLCPRGAGLACNQMTESSPGGTAVTVRGQAPD